MAQNSADVNRKKVQRAAKPGVRSKTASKPSQKKTPKKRFDLLFCAKGLLWISLAVFGVWFAFSGTASLSSFGTLADSGPARTQGLNPISEIGQSVLESNQTSPSEEDFSPKVLARAGFGVPGFAESETAPLYADRYDPNSEPDFEKVGDDLYPIDLEEYTPEQVDALKRSYEFRNRAALEKLEKIAPMVSLSGGTFRMGNNTSGQANQRPVHDVKLSPFEIDRYEVTNRQFLLFVTATNYVTSAEKRGWSYVFDLKTNAWVKMLGANFRNPGGDMPVRKDGTIPETLLDLPVVHVSFEDAWHFCKWAGKRLPSEAEWEYASKGGQIDTVYPWGSEREPRGRFMANYWQGWFPKENTLEDGFASLAPVGSFPANPYGLYDISGNVWEWCNDRYASDYYMLSPLENPQGPNERNCESAKVSDPVDGTVVEVPMRVIRGGSFLSSENYDAGYRIGVRARQAQSLSFQDVGFRCAR